jgi:hypothetical protein
MIRVKPEYEFVYTLEVGDIVHINGFPYTYIGDGKIAGNTDPEAAGEEVVKPEDPLSALQQWLSEQNQNPSPPIVSKPPFPWEPVAPWITPTWKPLGGGLLDDGLDNVVYGPGCTGLNTKIGSMKF